MNSFLPGITDFISSLDDSSIDKTRSSILQPLIDDIQNNIDNDTDTNLLFICTHNSRRSQFAQVWSKIAADFFNLKIQSYSGGTEVTEVHHNVINTLQSVGIETSFENQINPKYQISYSGNETITLYSKLYNEVMGNNLTAILVCADADESCPNIVGAKTRIFTPFNDPGKYDETSLVKEKYLDCMTIIATEMLYVFSKIVSK